MQSVSKRPGLGINAGVSFQCSIESLPDNLKILEELAYDLRWTGSQFVCSIWKAIDADIWARTQNPLLVLRNAPLSTLERLAGDTSFLAELDRWIARQRDYFTRRTWFDGLRPCALANVAYFSMEFMLGEALPIYSGGLGNVAGDQLKSASDLGVPVIGVGLLYQQGYFRQLLSTEGAQREALPFNDPGELTIAPALTADGREAQVRLELSGRTLVVRAWLARVGRTRLYLLDTNHPLNTAWDRGITASLYASGTDTRFLQELVLGVGGWRLLEELGIEVDVCHLNEGHAAFATLARAASYARRHGVTFKEALWTTRAGNVFTTHTPVEAAFDRFQVDGMLAHAYPFVEAIGIPYEELTALGKRSAASDEAFNMAYLAMRSCGFVNGVSQLHGRVSRVLFSDLFPRWPLAEVPVSAITNGVHVGTWDSPAANELWKGATGEEEWTSTLVTGGTRVAQLDERTIWEFRGRARAALVQEVRRRYSLQLAENGASADALERAQHVLDPNVLTIGFARRFTGYKRPNLVLQDEERFVRLIENAGMPVQFIVAGKAHPRDSAGKAMVQRMARFCTRSDVSHRVVFLQDYDMALAQWLTGGVDLWLNNPVRGNEASGTSGMKVLVNGGLNCSELDGWWDEAYKPSRGWALGGEGAERKSDTEQASELYALLEREIVPEFYARDDEGIPIRWAQRVRTSMAELTAEFSSDRTVRQYVETAYLPAAEAYRGRARNDTALGRALSSWGGRVCAAWDAVRISRKQDRLEAGCTVVHVHVFLGELNPSDVRVELYADGAPGEAPKRIVAELIGAIPGAVAGYHYAVRLVGERPSTDFTPRVIPWHAEARIPLELNLVCWA